MKDPREILLQQHHAAEPQLDLIRRGVLQRLGNAATSDTSDARRSARKEAPAATAFGLFAVLFPFRRHLAGMGIVWAVIAVLHWADRFDASPAASGGVAQVNGPSPRQLLMSLREHHRQLLEWIGPAVEPAPGVPQARPARRALDPWRRTQIA